MDEVTRIDIEPRRALVDTPLRITLAGFRPGGRVRVWASMTDDAGAEWESWAVFRSGPDGRVDLTERAPEEGTYTGVDAMGLVWSMLLQVPEPEQASLFVKHGLDPTVLTVSAEVDGKEVAATEAERLFVAPGVTVEEVREDGLAGVLCRPPGSGPHPAVVILSGSGGGADRLLAALLASHGYSGQDDAMWPSSVMAQRVADRLAAHDFPYAYEHIAYRGAGHMTVPPYLPTTVNASRHPVTGQRFAFGGEPRSSAEAQKDAWRRILVFLEAGL